MPQRNVASNFTFEQQRVEINNLAQDFWTQKGIVDTAASTYLKHDGSNAFTGGTLNVPSAFTISANSGNGTLTISGNLDVTGTTTTVSTANLEVTDKNILIAKGSTSDSQADGAGITIDSATDITWNFVDANDAFVSSIGVEATTHLKAARGQFIGDTSPTTGSGVEINAPDANTGQIIAYNRGSSAYNELRLRAASVGIYGGTSNALVGTFNSTGLTLESGSLSIPDSIVHSGDGNTKIRFPSNDSITFETGGSERFSISDFLISVQSGFQLGFLATSGPSPSIKSGGTDNQSLWLTAGSGNPARLTILPTGEVGIGVTAPAYPLDVVGDNGISSSASTNSTAGQISIVGKNSSGGVSAISRIKSEPSGSSSMAQMIFQTRNTAASMTERMRIAYNTVSGTERPVVLFGHNTGNITTSGGWTPQVQIHGTDQSGSLAVYGYNQGPEIILAMSSSGTVGTQAAVANTNITGRLRFAASDGNDMDTVGAEILSKVTDTVSSDKVPTDLQFWTSNTSQTVTHRMSVTKDGHVIPALDNTYDLGETGTRWRNIYTNDLHLSNKGSTNSVDNTWGDFTIQEGESDLFIINNRSGKKYKFNLMEVS